MSKNEDSLVLVADDEPSMLQLLSAYVRSKGYRVLEASDGDLAWQLAREHLPDVVVLDVMMPGMSGWEVCKKIREAVSLAHTGVIMLTGIGESLNEMTSPLYGADAYIDKPFEFSELEAKIIETLKSRGAGTLGRADAADEDELDDEGDEEDDDREMSFDDEDEDDLDDEDDDTADDDEEEDEPVTELYLRSDELLEGEDEDTGVIARRGSKKKTRGKKASKKVTKKKFAQADKEEVTDENLHDDMDSDLELSPGPARRGSKKKKKAATRAGKKAASKKASKKAAARVGKKRAKKASKKTVARVGKKRAKKASKKTVARAGKKRAKKASKKKAARR
jgi:DNA-binding response OmpR family regulator